MKNQRKQWTIELSNTGNELQFRLSTATAVATRLPVLPIKYPMMLPVPGQSAPPASQLNTGVGFLILKLYIKKHFKRITHGALQGPGVFQYPQKENHLLVGKSLSSPQDH